VGQLGPTANHDPAQFGLLGYSCATLQHDDSKLVEEIWPQVGRSGAGGGQLYLRGPDRMIMRGGGGGTDGVIPVTLGGGGAHADMSANTIVAWIRESTGIAGEVVGIRGAHHQMPLQWKLHKAELIAGNAYTALRQDLHSTASQHATSFLKPDVHFCCCVHVLSRMMCLLPGTLCWWPSARGVCWPCCHPH
jgi:hypothetical protein